MNILILCSRFPYPPNRGDRLRAYNIVRNLSSADHRLFLISFMDGKAEDSGLDHMRSYFERMIVHHLPRYRSILNAARGAFSTAPLQVAYYNSKKMKNAVHSFLCQNRVDLVYVHLFRMAPYVEDCRGPYKILDLTDVISKHLERSMKFRSGLDRQLYSAEWRRIESYEKKVCTKFNECWVISQKEAELLQESSPTANIKVIPNGVDLELFKPAEAEKDDRLIFVGHLSSAYNVDAVLFFCEQILPRVRQSFPSVRLCLVGGEPHRRIRALSGRDGIETTGFRSDLSGLLNRSKVFVAPFRFSSGVQNKILEAMATGLPVVSTSVANQGLKAKPDEEILVADHPEEFSAHIVDLLRDDLKRERMGLKARRFVESRFSWNRAVERIAEVEQVISSSRR